MIGSAGCLNAELVSYSPRVHSCIMKTKALCIKGLKINLKYNLFSFQTLRSVRIGFVMLTQSALTQWVPSPAPVPQATQEMDSTASVSLTA